MGSSVTESTSSDVLDLTNFDTCGHLSPFILTSPRSLLACRKAKIKASGIASISICIDIQHFHSLMNYCTRVLQTFLMTLMCQLS